MILLQSIINFLYRYPKAKINKVNRFGGYFNYLKMILSCNLMKEASSRLPPVNSYSNGLPVYFLTGAKYLYQTLFCIQSLTKASSEKFRFILVDDGSFDILIINRIKIQLPGSDIITKEDIAINLQNHLPKELYPILHRKREVYPHIKKLTDIHTLQGNKWKMVLDSDMLFWHEPREIIGWLKNPDRPLYMIDCEETYGYSRKLMEELCGFCIRPLINVGTIGLNSANINWNKLENWVKVIEEKEGTSYYLEQALTAMIIGEEASYPLNNDDYIVKPGPSIVNEKSGILHHYVDLSKEVYFKKAWKNI